MSVLPGLVGELSATPYRLFLGVLPTLGIHARLLRQLQPVYPWYTSKKRIKEQANEFLEIDLAACDAELVLRYAHVFYVRRELHNELVEKQMSLLDSGKAPPMANPDLLHCLGTCNSLITPRLQYELHLLREAKKGCRVPNRRELAPDAPLEAHDLLCMMRIVEEDEVSIPDAEMQARSFLPREHVERKALELGNMLFGTSAPTRLDKKDLKLLQRLVPSDYKKVGAVEKMRPVDVATTFRLFGARCASSTEQSSPHSLCASMWGHIFAKYATHPAYLRNISLYWSRFSQLSPSAATAMMPEEVAAAVCQQASLFPALRLRTHYLYTSADVARQQWRNDLVIPLLRAYPMMGAPAAEDLAAQLLVERWWATRRLAEEANPLQESILREAKQSVEELCAEYESSPTTVLAKVEEGCKMMCPPLTEEENRMVAGNAAPTTTTTTSAAATEMAAA